MPIHSVEQEAGNENQLVIVVGEQVSSIEGGSHPRARSAVLEGLIQLNGEVHIGSSRREKLLVARIVARGEFMPQDGCALHAGELVKLCQGLW